jgi:hypothetical protein
MLFILSLIIKLKVKGDMLNLMCKIIGITYLQAKTFKELVEE